MSISSMEVQKFRDILKHTRYRLESMKRDIDGVLTFIDTTDGIAVRLIEAFHNLESQTVPDTATQHAFEDEEKHTLRGIIRNLERQLRRKW